MKRIFILALLVGGLTAFTKRDLSVVRDELKELAGYKLRDNIISFEDYNLWAITNEEAFDKTFIAKNALASRPGFDTAMVLAAKLETMANTYKVTFRKVVFKKDVLNVYFSVQKEGLKQGNASPESVVTLAKNRKVKKVNFYHDDFLVRTIPIVTVY